MKAAVCGEFRKDLFGVLLLIQKLLVFLVCPGEVSLLEYISLTESHKAAKHSGNYMCHINISAF